MITPAPQRQQPRLPPPSTAQIPSKFMPMSSPAQFWKFADIESTPARALPDMSPLKGAEPGDDGGLGDIPSSSPPPPNLASPSKPGTSNGMSHHGRTLPPLKTEEAEFPAETTAEPVQEIGKSGPDAPDEEDEGGFDLARCVSFPVYSAVFLFFNPNLWKKQRLPTNRIISSAIKQRGKSDSYFIVLFLFVWRWY